MRKLYARSGIGDSGSGIRAVRIREVPRRPLYSSRKGKNPMRIVVLTAVLALAAGPAAAQTAPAEPKNYGIEANFQSPTSNFQGDLFVATSSLEGLRDFRTRYFPSGCFLTSVARIFTSSSLSLMTGS